MSQPDLEQPTPAGARPWWFGCAVVLFGAVWVYGALQLSITDRLSGIGPGAFVLAIGLALVVLGLLLLWQIARGERFEAESSEDALADAPVSYPALGMVLVALFLPTVVMSRLGFPLTGMISYTLVARALGSRNLLLNAAIGLILSAVCWYGFEKLGVQLGGFLPLLKI